LRELMHELRTPLNAIIGFGEIIEGQYLGPAHRAYRERATEIVRQARSLSDAVDNLDLAARLRSGRLHGEATSEARSDRMVLDELRMQAALRQLRLTIEDRSGGTRIKLPRRLPSGWSASSPRRCWSRRSRASGLVSCSIARSKPICDRDRARGGASRPDRTAMLAVGGQRRHALRPAPGPGSRRHDRRPPRHRLPTDWCCCCRWPTEEKWSGRQDSNLRPSAPKADALPGCATPRLGRRLAGAWRLGQPAIKAPAGACSSTVEPAAHNGQVGGSNPSGPTTY
jgi:hypothetical protein